MNKTQAELFHESAFAAEKFILPQEMAADFVVIELLSENDLGSTFLLSKRADGSKYVLKCYRKSETEGIGKESEIMRGLSHIGLPSFEADYDDGEAVFVLREFAQGISLDDYLEENTRIEPALTVKIISALCDTLSYLHSQPAPIIHRDVKPSNIIINLSDNSVKLIDFGISRTYTEGAKNDTQQYGTKPFSAPE
ncbi:MAG: protein kinase, partial [Clostridiales bacterium]|nr:protein kinase [Clostridiales bacterium]